MFARILFATALAVTASTTAEAAASRMTSDVQPSFGRAIGEIIYRASGVVSRGTSDYAGSATVVHCSNTTPSSASFQLSIRDSAGSGIEDLIFALAPYATRTYATKYTNAYVATAPSVLAPVTQGSLIIRGTLRGIICSASQVDAGDTNPDGVALHMVRFAPISGTQE